MKGRDRMSAGFALIAVAAATMMFAPAANAKVPVKFKTMAGYPSPGSPANVNVVGVLKTGDPKAKNVLVLNPGTSASAAYFEPLAKTIVKDLPNWQIWAVERRENFLEDQSELNLLKQGKVSPTDFFNYYLGYLSNPGVTKHLNPVPDSAVPFARQWGMNTEINDLRVVVKAAAKGGRNVAMGGHSLGGSITTAYATWDFNGRPGGRDLSGLVLIDGSSGPTPVTADQAQTSLDKLQTSSPWLAFGGIPAPLAGLFGTVGSAATKASPNTNSVFQGGRSSPRTCSLRPGSTRRTRGFGRSTDVKTSPSSRSPRRFTAASSPPAATRAAGTAPGTSPHPALGDHVLGLGTPEPRRHGLVRPMRLTIDSGAVGNGVANPAQAVLDVHSTDASKLRKSLKIYASPPRSATPG